MAYDGQHDEGPGSWEDVEVNIIREERKEFLHGVPVLLVLLASMTLSCETRMVGLTSIVLTLIGASPTALMSFDTRRANIIKQAGHAQMSGAVLRIFIHMLWIVFHPEQEFMKLVCLFAFPVSLARQRGSQLVYVAFLVANNLLAVYRFAGNLEVGLPSIAVGFVISLVSMDFVSQKQRGFEMRLALSATMRHMAVLSRATARSLLDCFCDAVVALGPDLTLLEPSPDLTSLLDRKADEGKSFESFIHLSDVADHRDRVASLLDESSWQPGSVQLQSIRVNLQDSYNLPVQAHLFHVSHKCPNQGTVLYVGISESWQPPDEPKKQSKSKRLHRSRGPNQLCMETGKIIPAGAVFPTRHGKGVHFERTFVDHLIGPYKRRSDSPRPNREY
mmetsp:Transcript_23652/g.67327  ORF Transcript_23652/g.67327 Transcript_23652/m.67327 type:complete len:389 (-) Transcript_23652:187-1353(-)